MCMLQGTAATGHVIPPRDFQSWIGRHPSRGDVTTVPDHSHWLRPQLEAGGGRGEGGADGSTEVGCGPGQESEELRDTRRKRESPPRELCCLIMC